MVVAALQLGVAIRTAFDLYRSELREALGLIPGRSFTEEYEQWQKISEFFRNQDQGRNLDYLIGSAKYRDK